MSSPTKIQLAVLVTLVTATIAAIAGFYLCPRTLEVSPQKSDWRVSTFDSRSIGGSSVSESSISDHGFEMNFRLGEAGPRRFARMVIEPKNPRQLNPLKGLNWFESVSVKASVEGAAGERFSFNLVGDESGSQATTSSQHKKYQEVSLNLTSQPQVYRFSKESFRVPLWRVEGYAVSLKDAAPTFDQLTRIEFCANNSAVTGECALVIESITFQGHYLPQSTFLKVIVLFWAGIGIMTLMIALIGQRRNLNSAKLSQQQLASENESLNIQTRELTTISRLDPLTKLYNRRGMRDSVSVGLDALRERQQRLSVIIFDVDNFKKINDVKGHAYGDEVLVNIARAASEVISESQTLARWGGEEFLVLCQRSDGHQAAKIAERIRSKFETELSVTCSFGVCEVFVDDEFKDALDEADKCLYDAKRSGRNCVRLSARRDGSIIQSSVLPHRSSPNLDNGIRIAGS